MRIYEIAKQYGVGSSEFVSILKDNNFDVKNHMSIASDEVILFAKNYFNKSKDEKIDELDKKQENVEKKVNKIEAINEEVILEKNILNGDVKKNMQTNTSKIQDSIKDKNDAVLSSVTEKTFSPIDKKNNEKKTAQSDIVISLKAMTVGQFADFINISVSEVIITLLKKGLAFNKNIILTEAQVVDLAAHYGIGVSKVSTAVNNSYTENSNAFRLLKTENIDVRTPVVVVMGHVDHGKTTLLDYIRSTRVAAKEKGGITQHLGAYQVKTKHGNLVFLDTPGHEAFAKIRKRGACVADIVILVVAADDGVMPQTVESIKAAKALNIPIVVAMNKVDKVDEARLEIIKRQLVQYDLVPEQWGGEVVCVGISAKTGQGIDLLLEVLILQSQMMDLYTNPNEKASGFVLESKMEKGRGCVSTVICRSGTIKIGDYFVSGNSSGKVVGLIDCFGVSLKSAGPSVPALVIGFNLLADVGSMFNVISESEYNKIKNAKEISKKALSVSVSSKLSARNIIKMIIKKDNNSSLEAVLDWVEKNTGKINEVSYSIISYGVGKILESDVEYALDSGAVILGLHVKAESSALLFARNNDVKIELYEIIYKFFESLQERSKNIFTIKTELKKIGEAVVLKVFDIKKIGIVAGCHVRDGRLSDKGSVKIFRRKQEVGSGKINSLQRDKKTVKEIHTGFECAFMVDNFSDWQVDDVVECYLEVQTSNK